MKWSPDALSLIYCNIWPWPLSYWPEKKRATHQLTVAMICDQKRSCNSDTYLTLSFQSEHWTVFLKKKKHHIFSKRKWCLISNLENSLLVTILWSGHKTANRDRVKQNYLLLVWTWPLSYGTAISLRHTNSLWCDLPLFEIELIIWKRLFYRITAGTVKRCMSANLLLSCCTSRYIVYIVRSDVMRWAWRFFSARFQERRVYWYRFI